MQLVVREGGLHPPSETECILTVCRERGAANGSGTEVSEVQQGIPRVGAASMGDGGERVGAVTNSRLCRFSSSSTSRKCFTDRAIRSEAQTRTTSKRPRRASRISSSSPGRQAFAPEDFPLLAVLDLKVVLRFSLDTDQLFICVQIGPFKINQFLFGEPALQSQPDRQRHIVVGSAKN